ncbi:MAG: PEP-CTERM sorting domain-containing protein [Leptolyngbyaceae cyanobacterium SL_7_1]|nr:PEP-CTERM sorting domain-containing protein [Leptolyngbyaceae cyanobacterium SL_7_1]
MKPITLTVTAALGLITVAVPVQAAEFRWNVEYTGFFAEGASIFGNFVADEADAVDGIVSDDEFESWIWNWSGNTEIPAFSISSADGSIDSAFGASFYVDGTPNVPGSGLDEGVYTSDSGTKIIDLSALLVEDLDAGINFPFGTGAIAQGNASVASAVNVSDPEIVPEPATMVGLVAVLAGMGMSAAQRQKRSV